MLSNINIGNGVTTIEYAAFYNCTSLTSVILGDNITSIDNDVFYGCSLLQYNEKDGLLYLGNDINKYLYLISTETKDITTANIDSKCKIIYDNAFYGCRFLESIIIPETIISIGDYAFKDCISVDNITLLNKVTNIGKHVFSNCYSLKTLTIPNSITSIHIASFECCTSLNTINFSGTIGEWLAIQKDDYWNFESHIIKVICTDGEVIID